MKLVDLFELAVVVALVPILMCVIAFAVMRKQSSCREQKPGMAASNDRLEECGDELTKPSRFAYHDIFLSHSGKQKGFVRDLYKVLHSRGYSVFFDITHHSLPPGENFPTIIMESAATCKLALVVLSDDFLCSKWPMIELCAFVDAQSSINAEKIKILPIFFKVSPSDLNLQQNREKWRLAWEAFAKKDPARVNVTKWECALDTVDKLNGLVFDPFKLISGETSYIQNILSSISKILPPLIKYDMPHVRGEQRLCKIICAKFTDLESSMAQPSELAPTPKVCVLGMYGPPGSGKSTLSKCLCNRYARQFNGRAFNLELPANPTKEQLVKISKKILEQITDFSDMVDLGIATDLDQVYSLLRTYLPRSNVFLVVDNIMPHDLVIDFVHRILMFDFQAGSKVLLVARAYGVLKRLYSHRVVKKKCREVKFKYAYGSVKVPSINKEEAVQILLQSAQGGWLIDEQLDPKDQKIVETVIDLCSFGHQEFLPMVVKIMGAELGDLNYEEWGTDMKALCNRARLCKEEAVMKVVSAIFDKLPLNLQILFLDLALFILAQSYCYRPNWSVHMLSIMRECPIDKIKKDMENLQRHCFLEEGEEFRVHDVFLEFARTCPGSCMYYILRHELISVPNKLPPPSEQAREKGLRAVVLELNDAHERFDFWQGFSSVKALVLRNCKSLTVLSLPVGLKSLVILNIDKCPLLKFVEVEELISISNSVRSFTVNNGESSISNSVRSFRRRNNELESSSCMMIQQSIVAHSRGPAPMKMSGFALQMIWLQHLCLANTGIKRLENMSKCWPHLREITIQESCLEYLELGKLPNLEVCAVTTGAMGKDDLADFVKGFGLPSVSEKMQISSFGGQNVLAECPNLKYVCILGAYAVDENCLGTLSSSKLQTLGLGNAWHGKSFPDLAKASQSLSRVVAWDCRELKCVNFMHRYEVLKELTLVECPSLIRVYGLDHLVSLRALIITRCGRLQTVSKLSGLVTLGRCQVEDCCSLESLGGVRDLVGLDEFSIGRRCSKLEMLHSDLQTLTQLTQLYYYPHAFQPGVLELTNFESLKYLTVFFIIDALNSTGSLISLGNLPRLERLSISPYYIRKEEVNSCEKRELDVAKLLGVSHLSNVFSMKHIHIESVHSLASLNGIGFFLRLRSLQLTDLPNLASLNGIGCLQALEELSIKNVQNLACLNEMETLAHLEKLQIEDCESIEELPSLSLMLKLSHLILVNCSKLKDVDGCNASGSLNILHLKECKEMAHFPYFRDLLQLKSLTIGGSKFASNIDSLVQWAMPPKCSTDLYLLKELQTIHGSKITSIDRLVQWEGSVEDFDEDSSMGIVPPNCIRAIVLQRASIEALFWEFCHSNCDVEVRMRMGKMVLQTVGVELIERRIPKDDDCYDFSAWAYWPDRMHRRTVEMLEEVSSKSKSWLKEQCQSNTLFQEHIIGCLAASKYNAWRFPKVLNDICCYPRMPFFFRNVF